MPLCSSLLGSILSQAPAPAYQPSHVIRGYFWGQQLQAFVKLCPSLQTPGEQGRGRPGTHGLRGAREYVRWGHRGTRSRDAQFGRSEERDRTSTLTAAKRRLERRKDGPMEMVRREKEKQELADKGWMQEVA